VHKGARGREDAQSFREREWHGAVAERGQPQPSARREADISAEFVAGRRAVLEALRSDRALNKLLVQDDVSGGSVGELLGIARAKGVVIQRVPRARLDEIAQSRGHQGVLAYTAAHSYAEIEQLLESVPKGKPGLLVVLDGIEDPHNLGSILRSSECAGAHGVIIPKRRSVALTGAVAKASAGAIEYIPVARVGNVNQVLKTLRELGYWVVGADPDGSSLYDDLDYGAPTAFVIGGEGRGLSPLTAKSCDALVRLPMQGHIASLNAGVAAGVLLFEAIRQRRSV
jgi:23S rRNA (guanosine2251-2'-O)-methyltransferase